MPSCGCSRVCMHVFGVASLQQHGRNRHLFRRTLVASALVAFGMAWQAATIHAQSPTTHDLTLASSNETTDSQGRLVLVWNVKGDLPGTLTLRMTMSATGAITGGDWALDVSYIEFGPLSSDGDHEESLIQRGVLKGSIAGGAAVLNSTGTAVNLSGVQLVVTGATQQFSSVRSGSGSIVGSQLDNSANSNGLLALTF